MIPSFGLALADTTAPERINVNARVNEVNVLIAFFIFTLLKIKIE